MPFDLLTTPTREPAECLVEVEGAAIEALYPFLLEVRVETDRNAPDTATLVFESRRDETGRWLVQDATDGTGEYLLREWNRILIKAAFGNREEEVLRGFIRQVRCEYPQDPGAARVTLECQDESLQLDREHQRQVWGTSEQPTSDSLILREIIGRYAPLAPDSLSGTGQEGLVGINQDGTDIRFLQTRAEENGYELIFRRGAVYFGPMRPGLPTPQPTILMYAGRDASGISLNVSGDAHQPDGVALDLPTDQGQGSREARLEPNLPVMGRTHAGSTDRGLSPFVWRLSGRPGAEAEARRLESQAQQRANEADLRRVQAEGELDGTLYGHVLLPGLPVAVDGVGTRLSGIYYVNSVTHSFTPQGYRQRFRLLRNAFGDTLDALPSPGPLAAVMGGLSVGVGLGVGL